MRCNFCTAKFCTILNGGIHLLSQRCEQLLFILGIQLMRYCYCHAWHIMAMKESMQSFSRTDDMVAIHNDVRCSSVNFAPQRIYIKASIHAFSVWKEVVGNFIFFRTDTRLVKCHNYKAGVGPTESCTGDNPSLLPVYICWFYWESYQYLNANLRRLLLHGLTSNTQ